jgi:glycosyltransferase involved in cell wall biosynthesis
MLDVFARGPFDAAFYLETYPDVAESGMDPRDHYLNFGRVEGRVANAAELCASEREPFDTDFYLKSNPDVAGAGIDPYDHYIRFGKEEGRLPYPQPPASSIVDPSAKDQVIASYPKFDAKFYFEAFPDVAASGASAFEHYLKYGRYERRVTHGVDLNEQWLDGAIDSLRSTILVVSHDASRTGAPVLAWNICRKLAERFNVVTVLLAGGPLVDDFRDTCAQTIVLPEPEMRHPLVLEHLIRDITARLDLRLAIVNSIESRMAVEPFAERDCQVLLLVHEYASYTPSWSSVVSAINCATAVVFSAQSVRHDADQEETRDALASSVVLRQGKSFIPLYRATDNSHDESAQGRTADRDSERSVDAFDQVANLLNKASPRPRLILGAGTVQFRKGVDLFIATAAEFLVARPADDVLFVWVGDDPELDLSYTACLRAQLRDPRLKGRVLLLKSTGQLEKLYPLADIFYLPSRLDPLPNVAIDAMTAGLPIICFDGTGGIPEILADSRHKEASIASFSSTVAASGMIADLLDDSELRKQVGSENQLIAERTFNMDMYVNRLVHLLDQTAI